MKLGTEERSVGKTYVSTGRPGRIQYSMSIKLLVLLRDQKMTFWTSYKEKGDSS
ncbi:hypothetical protein J14TS5_37120 [Paenibacillus lautus]|nr:hypothetical protein J14TS5_37120 [Paenibacillus lautus]